jgi:hypothetical protein
MIKKRIEDLIERGYMKRDPNQRDKYIYLPWKDLILQKYKYFD